MAAPVPIFTTSYGTPVKYPHATQRVTNNVADGNGVVLLQDSPYIEALAHLARERIPERIVHAKGAGAHGTFTVTAETSEMEKYTSSKFLLSKGTEVDATVRFSTVTAEMGSADTNRNPHGFAIKLKTLEGILDLVLLNNPVFFIRDPAKYPDLTHITQRNPQTNLTDAEMLWDFMSSNPETVHELMHIYSDQGTPDGYYKKNGYSGTTFVLSRDGRPRVAQQEDAAHPFPTNFHYARFYVYYQGEVKTLSGSDAIKLAGENPDYGTQQLFKAIENGESIKYHVKVQLLHPHNIGKLGFDPLDATKDWLLTEEQYKKYLIGPLEIGTLELKENPQNYFDEIEQLAFAPSHLIPWIEASPDALLQGRLFIYPDTQRYRLGVNNQQLPCNRPPSALNFGNFLRAGRSSFISQGNRENYQAFKYRQPGFHFDSDKGIDTQINNNARHEIFQGGAYRFLHTADRISQVDFNQPAAIWKKWSEDEKEVFVNNITSEFGDSLRALKELNLRILFDQLLVFACVDPLLAERIADALDVTFICPIPPLRELQENLKNYQG